MYIEKICQYCGKHYMVAKSQEKRTKFCSDKCFRASKNTRQPYKCDYCGKMFMAQASQINKVRSGNKKGLYCSAQCAKDVQKPKWDDIVQLFKSRDYTLISKEYINAKTKLQYICNKHKSQGVQSITYNNLKCGYGCKYCGDERTVNARRLGFDTAKAIFAKHNM